MKRPKSNYQLRDRIRASSQDLTFDLHEYGVEMKSNHIYLMGSDFYQFGAGADFTQEPGVEFTMANRFIKNLNLCMAANPSKPILIHMKTCGGYWEEGMAIYDAITSCPLPVIILNYSHARSMSSIIMQAADKRVMMPNGHFMFHRGEEAISGTAKQVESNVMWYKRYDTIMLNIYADRMKDAAFWEKKTQQQIKTWLRGKMDKKEDVFLTATDSIKYGFADEIFDFNWKKLTKV